MAAHRRKKQNKESLPNDRIEKREKERERERDRERERERETKKRQSKNSQKTVKRQSKDSPMGKALVSPYPLVSGGHCFTREREREEREEREEEREIERGQLTEHYLF
jgi:hypothetical protein